MSNLRNSVRLAGFLGNQPEVKVVGDNKKLVRVSLATNDTYRNDKGELVKDTQWHNLVLWNKNAQLAEQYLNKGSEITVEGKLTSRSYTDKEGQKRYVTEILVSEILMMGRKV
ncbi:single-stranded DNA-binding protein (plasmid) [Pedobacter sp. BS3]|uniref:single-stranded DNA-binding protein n=1 Tax=Pedobacter sp. BS3 TaxID=2567937 RepID=UPI0011ED40C2|nr:single-stranded DNA-binding protein [Pedobacter sp. BS3]TZF86076.1 single-stranded DNA-binding protein [Pedobacter sp. BS3]